MHGQNHIKFGLTVFIVRISELFHINPLKSDGHLDCGLYKDLILKLQRIFRVIKSGRMRWAGHVACVVCRRGVFRVLVGKLEGKSHLEDPGLDGRIILR